MIIKHSISYPSLEEAPTPPEALMQYKEKPEAHLNSGSKDFNSLKEFCADHFDLTSRKRILDFGCSNARVTRWHDTTNTEVWGCDIQQDKIVWAKENLGNKIKFLVNTDYPHLPFEDNYFDFIYAHSVFTHLDKYHQAWLLELLRITKSYLMLTVHDEETMDLVKTPRSAMLRKNFFKDFPENGVDSSIGFFAANSYNSLQSQVYMTHEYINSLLPNNVKIIKTKPRVFADLQTGIMLLKS